jgi:vancomycin permeability regulator SanA
MMRKPRWTTLLLIALLLILGLLAPSLYVAMATSAYRYDNLAALPARRVAIVFGAGVRPDGRLSPMLADRVGAAVELYQLGRVEKLLMTGDNSRIDYDEVTAMRDYAIERGVPASDITRDYAGFRTYDSCYRARAIFGVEQATLITQRYHLPRAVYSCRQLGVEAIGIGTPDWGIYRDALLLQYSLREALATGQALWELHITQPQPMFLGPFEGIMYTPPESPLAPS